MDAIVKSLWEWHETRHLTVEDQRAGLFGNVMEELTELVRARTDDERVDALCDICIFAINSCNNKVIYRRSPSYDVRLDGELTTFVNLIIRNT